MSDALNSNSDKTGYQAGYAATADTTISQAQTSSSSKRVQLALDSKDPDVLITVEERNGDLLFIVELTRGPVNLADLRALFFTVSDSSLLPDLTVHSHAITVREKGSEKVIVTHSKDIKVAVGDGIVVKVGDTGSANINGGGQDQPQISESSSAPPARARMTFGSAPLPSPTRHRILRLT